MTNITKTVLVSTSTGERGNNGKKKIYEIVVEDNFVTLSWGMAEKSVRQTQKKWFPTHLSANNFVFEKKWEKIDKGYEVVFTA